jgi:predicted metal-binding membrane protein
MTTVGGPRVRPAAAPGLRGVALPAALLGLALTAWAALIVLERSPWSAYLGHGPLASGELAILPLLVFTAGWTLMTLAMMLPTSVPLVVQFERVVHAHERRAALLGLLVGGYLAAWAACGLALYAADLGIHRLVTALPWLDRHAWLIGAGAFLAAGAYQLSPLKHRCLARCRSPRLFVISHWRGRPLRDSLRLGAAHGLFCVGCCWALMAVMFAVAHGNLLFMLALAAIMAIEKNLSWGARLTRPLGLVLLAEGAVLVGVGIATG